MKEGGGCSGVVGRGGERGGRGGGKGFLCTEQNTQQNCLLAVSASSPCFVIVVFLVRTFMTEAHSWR